MWSFNVLWENKKQKMLEENLNEEYSEEILSPAPKNIKENGADLHECTGLTNIS